MELFTKKSWSLVGILSIAALSVACGEDADDPLNAITCADVCERYQECFDSDYDVDDCVSRCENETSPDEEKEAELEECEACIDDESCTASVFECTTECAQFVP